MAQANSMYRWVVVLLVVFSSSLWLTAESVSIKCGKCEESRCPELHYCEGEAVKDHCGCCTVCSSSKYQPHPLIPNVGREGSACQQVTCPKFKVCVENVQGLPLCTCPSDYICRNRNKRQRPVCGTDGITYDSRCHLRIAACNSAVRVKVDRKGPCNGAEVPRPRTCESFSTCRKRKNQHTVCGTDGKSYISRCHMKIVACQRGVKIKVKNAGICQNPVNHGPSSDQIIGTRGIAMDTSSSAVRTGSRKWKKRSGSDESRVDDDKTKRRRRRREKRRKRKERRRKRRKARGKSGKRRSRRFKIDKNLFHKTFGHITWK